MDPVDIQILCHMSQVGKPVSPHLYYKHINQHSLGLDEYCDKCKGKVEFNKCRDCGKTKHTYHKLRYRFEQMHKKGFFPKEDGRFTLDKTRIFEPDGSVLLLLKDPSDD
jgi:hypothetical protein